MRGKIKTKIVATIGPSSENIDTIKKMIHNGMSIARINTKYGDTKQYEKIIHNIGQVGGCEIMIDIKKLEIIDWINTQKVEYVAIAFADGAKKIKKIKNMLDQKSVKIISKIENKKGIVNLDNIIKVSDGIMIARGDLGKNITFDKLPIIQKLIIKKARKKKIFDITATEMLLSMTKKRIPTRAEVSDVANAVLDGTFATMLSEETAIGKYPALTVGIMRRIIETTEKHRGLLK